MNKPKTKVYFLGAGDFAVPYLAALAQAPEIELVGVGTQPDKPCGRKRVLTPTPLGIFADENRIPCERITSVNADDFHARMEQLRPDIIVVVSFGQLLKEWILNFPEFGCLNVHGSILPRHRGAAPITSMILSRDAEAGVTFMRMDKGLDTGPIYEIRKFRMPEDATRGGLNLQLAGFGAQSIVQVVLNVVNGAVPVPQDESLATFTKKIRKTDGSVCWSEPSERIVRKIRAFYPWPGSAFRIASRNGGNTLIKITQARMAEGSGVPGTTLDRNGKWVIACGEGAVEIQRLIPEGSREMCAADFLRGARPELLEKVLDGPPPPEVKQPEKA